MKKILFLCGIIATLFTACELPGDGSDAAATIKITSKTEISVGSGNVMGMITYELLNPVVGATIEATANVDWINTFDFSTMGKIGYKVDINLHELDIKVIDGETTILTNVEVKVNSDEFMKIMKTIGAD